MTSGLTHTISESNQEVQYNLVNDAGYNDRIVNKP